MERVTSLAHFSGKTGVLVLVISTATWILAAHAVRLALAAKPAMTNQIRVLHRVTVLKTDQEN